MRVACEYVQSMPKMIQIRNVPDDLHRRLKVLATQAGMSLSDYLLAEIRQAADRPTAEEFRRRIESRKPVNIGESAAEAVRAIRGEP